MKPGMIATMRYTLLFALTMGLFSCDRTELPDDAAARAAGEYQVQSYVINGDTLYGAGRIDKIGLSKFYISVGRKTADSLNVRLTIQKTADAGQIVFSRKVGFREAGGAYELHLPQTTPNDYQSSINHGVFEEKTVLGGLAFMVLPPSYSLPEPQDPALRGVWIHARK